MTGRPHILLAADIFRDEHVRKIAATADGWATWERIPEKLQDSHFAEKLARADIVTGWAPGRLLASSPAALYLCGSAGIDAYRSHGLERKPDFTICNAANIMSIPIAEHALALMFALTRHILDYLKSQKAREFSRIPDGGELFGATICIAGVGGAGTELARRCDSLGMKVIGVRRDTRQHPDFSTIHPLTDLAAAVAGADHVVCTLPDSRETAHAFNTPVFAAMKPGAFFYNVSRGGPVDSNALADALARGHLAGAGLDVHDPEPVPADSLLWDLPNVILTGHSAGWSTRLPDRLSDLFVTNLLNRRHGRPLVNIVNL